MIVVISDNSTLIYSREAKAIGSRLPDIITRNILRRMLWECMEKNRLTDAKMIFNRLVAL